MLASWRLVPILLVLCLPVSTVVAATGAGAADAQASFRSGVKAFGAGDLQLARQFLEEARSRGLTRLSLHYNLGVVYFRLGEYSLAETEFTALLDSDHRTLAMYNLGLVALGAGNTLSARDWFSSVRQSGSDDKLVALATRQLDRLQASQQEMRVADREWQGYLSLAGGYDDNIASAPESAATGRSGAAWEAILAGSGIAAGNRDAGLRIEGAAYTRRYPSASDFNTDLVRLGVAWLQQAGPGRLVTTVSGSQSWLDSRELERQTRLDLAYEADNCALLGNGGDCKATLSGSSVTGGEAFQAYDGEWYRAAFRARKKMGAWRLDAEYRYEVNNRDDLETFWEFYSVSPRRHFVEAGVRRLLTSRLQIGVEAGYRHSRYPDPHRLISDGVIRTLEREDERVEGGVLARYVLSRQWVISAEWNLTDNDSTIDRYEYRRQTAQIALEGVF